VLPPVIDEGKFFPFKFWFNHGIQDGMYYHNELYYRLQSSDINHRAQLYHYACRIAQRAQVVVTATETHCSIWVSLRSASITLATPSNQDFSALLGKLDDQENP